MEDNTVIFLTISVIMLTILGIGYMFLYENQYQTQLETCLDNCYYNDEELEIKCELKCIETFSKCENLEDELNE